MNRSLTVLLGLLWAMGVQGSTLPLESRETRRSASATPLRAKAANTPGKDQYGDGPPVTRNGQIHLQFTAKDNDGLGNAMSFDYLRLNRRVGASRTLIAADETNKTITANWVWWSVNLSTSSFGLAVGDTILFEWEIQFSDFAGSHHNLYYVRVNVGEPLPAMADWRRVDFHVHGFESDDQIHAGMHYGHMAAVGRQVGLDAIGVSDHSPNVLPAEWTTIVNECATNSSGSFLMFPGLELTLDDNETNEFPDGRLHLLALGLTRLLPAPEECCTDNASGQLWFLRQALDSVAVQGGVALAAHPTDGAIFPNEGTLGIWSQTNYDIGASYPPSVFVGLEFFNERRRTFNLGDNQYARDEFIYPYAWQPNPSWDSHWQAGMERYLQLVQRYVNPWRPLALAGSSDAHQSAYESYFEAPDDVGVYQNGLGGVHSLVYAPGSLTQANILSGLKQGAVIMTDGPVMAASVDQDGNGSIDGTIGGQFALSPSAQLALAGSSLAEFGNFTVGRIIRVTPTNVDTTILNVNSLSFNIQAPAYAFTTPGSWTAVLVDVRTVNGYRVVTSPVYFASQGSTDVTSAAPGLWLAPPQPNPTAADITITFSLPAAGRVDLSVYDPSGRLVTSLFHGTLSAGSHSVPWRRMTPPAGLYIVRLATETGSVSRKVVLLD